MTKVLCVDFQDGLTSRASIQVKEHEEYGSNPIQRVGYIARLAVIAKANDTFPHVAVAFTEFSEEAKVPEELLELINESKKLVNACTNARVYSIAEFDELFSLA